MGGYFRLHRNTLVFHSPRRSLSWRPRDDYKTRPSYLISYSGETEEVTKLLPSLKHFGCNIISMVGKPDSTLEKHSDVILNVAVDREVCPSNLAPTISTMATMGMGDALAVALINARDFKPIDFAVFHPGGSLGRKLLTQVRDVMKTNVPTVQSDSSVHECLFVTSVSPY